MIGALQWICFIYITCATIFLILYCEIVDQPYYYWWLIPGVLSNLVLGLIFNKVRRNENGTSDYETRLLFYKTYLILGVIVNLVL